MTLLLYIYTLKNEVVSLLAETLDIIRAAFTFKVSYLDKRYLKKYYLNKGHRDLWRFSGINV